MIIFICTSCTVDFPITYRLDFAIMNLRTEKGFQTPMTLLG